MEIKIRAWDQRQEVMEYIDDLCWFGENYYHHIEHDIVLTQWTRLKDANGKDIYEGDVVKSLPSNGLIKKDALSIVGFMDGLGCHPFVSYPEYTAWDHRECVVVGNAYENPELRELKKHECQHKSKTYKNHILLTSHPAQRPWVCDDCGKNGSDYVNNIIDVNDVE